jgi:PBSX family phage terminase large subunit
MNENTTPLFATKTKLFDALFNAVYNVKSNKTIYILQGGSSSSKTYSICQLLIYHCITYAGTEVAIIGESLGSLKIGALSDMLNSISGSDTIRKQIKRDNIFTNSAEGLIVDFRNGSKIIFRGVGSPSQSGHADAKSSQKSKAGKRDILFINEANGIAEVVANELILRTRQLVFIDFNANMPFWAHYKYSLKYIALSDLDEAQKQQQYNFINEKVQWIYSNYTHNQYCPNEIIQQLKEYKHTNQMRYNVYTLGKTGNADDYKLWLYSFNQLKHIKQIEPHKYLPLIFSFDFNHRDMSVSIAQTNMQLERKAYSRVRGATIPKTVFFNVLDEVLIKEPDAGKSSLKQALETIAQRYHTQIVSGNFYVCGDLSGANSSHLVPSNSWEEIYAFLHTYAQIHKGVPAGRSRYFARTIAQDKNYPAANQSHKTSNEICNNAIFELQERFTIHPKCKYLISDCNKAKFAETKNDAFVLFKDAAAYNMNMFDTLRYALGFVFFDTAK